MSCAGRRSIGDKEHALTGMVNGAFLIALAVLLPQTLDLGLQLGVQLPLAVPVRAAAP